MKKIIPILSVVTGSVFLQNCEQRDEEIIPNIVLSDKDSNILMMREDSARSSQPILDPDPDLDPDSDPPVRDGDNWRLVQITN